MASQIQAFAKKAQNLQRIRIEFKTGHTEDLELAVGSGKKNTYCEFKYKEIHSYNILAIVEND